MIHLSPFINESTGVSQLWCEPITYDTRYGESSLDVSKIDSDYMITLVGQDRNVGLLITKSILSTWSYQLLSPNGIEIPLMYTYYVLELNRNIFLQGHRGVFWDIKMFPDEEAARTYILTPSAEKRLDIRRRVGKLQENRVIWYGITNTGDDGFIIGTIDEFQKDTMR